MSYVDPKRSKAARKGWATRRVNQYLKDYSAYTGRQPACVTVCAEDYERLNGYHPQVELRRGAVTSPEAKTVL